MLNSQTADNSDKMANVTGIELYKLTRIQVTDRELGHGSYATVLELEYMGLKCAGKKIHELLLRQGDTSYTVRRFEEECRLLSQVRHPNIVQFLGVYFQQGARAPILVMEFLPTNLTPCIEKYGILPKEISYSILHDVALGLCYLHSQTPPIIHRDLSSNNVLLTPNMTAKISDLGVARILNLTPLQVSHMTQTPGTPAYMPPEVMIANPKYDTSVDEFSYGILMIHMFSGKWPEPQVGPIRISEAGKMIPVSEVERREVFLQAIGNNHPSMKLIHKCINNDPQLRPHASEIVERLSDMVLQFPASFANQLEMLRNIENQEDEKRSLREEGERKDQIIQQNENQISIYKKEVQTKEQQKAAEIDQLKVVHFSEVELLRLQVRDLNAQNQLLNDEKEAEVTELKSKAALHEAQIEQFHTQLAKEREKYASENHDLLSEVATLRIRNDSLQHTNSLLKLEADNMLKDGSISSKDAAIKRNESELEAKTKLLQEKYAIISEMSEQLTRAREYLATKQQVSSVCVFNMYTWITGTYNGMISMRTSFTCL